MPRFNLIACLGVIAMLWLGGCKSSPTQYSSPRVTGTVLDAQTRQPVKGVRVRRPSSTQEVDPNVPPRGGQVMAAESAVFTAADGSFAVDSVKDFSVFRNSFWYTVSLSFEREGYESRVATFTPAQATQAPNGEPVVKTGNIFLQPKSR